MTDSYKIISDGYPVDGKSRQEVIEGISARFKMNLEKAARLVAGKPIVIKSGLNPSAMQKYSAVMKTIGLKFRVEPAGDIQDEIDADAAASGFTCPKCGYKQEGNMHDPASSCAKCGVLFSRFFARETVQTSVVKTDDSQAVNSEAQTGFPKEALNKWLDLYNESPDSIKNFWRMMGVVCVIALLRAIAEGGIGFFLGVVVGITFCWIYLPYRLMREKGVGPWAFLIVWTFPFGLILLSGSAKAYFLSETD